ncbi:hypothetical protein H6P81_019847 [Aristolochia fimbriata]|uniref:Uncharacterized protein n=1 Tax=Aristolochia fimbriata TaxID=158543 RepID=A0AAV7DW35_ARIFI|nr:hypothetical protein H6P81_019847 [Aristolochia fimbriata]
MWGDGGRFYWERREGGQVKGIAVVFTSVWSQDRRLKCYIDLYSSLGWNSLVCHAHFLNRIFSDKATALAFGVVDELVKELKARPLPVVFIMFSGSSKACLCKVLQIIEGQCEEQIDQDDCQLIKECICGHIHDSSHLDLISNAGTSYFPNPTIFQISHPSRLFSWMVKTISSGFDVLLLNRFAAQSMEYWQTLHSSANIDLFLLICSENDELASKQIICKFSQCLQELGVDVKLVKWSTSPYVGHFKQHPTDYKALVSELLEKASLSYSHRSQRVNAEKMVFGTSDPISDVCNLSKATARRLTIDPGNHIIRQNSADFGDRDIGSMQDKQKQKSDLLNPSISAHSVLGEILFDVCVPKKIKDWDIKNVGSISRETFGSPSGRNPYFLYKETEVEVEMKKRVQGKIQSRDLGVIWREMDGHTERKQTRGHLRAGFQGGQVKEEWSRTRTEQEKHQNKKFWVHYESPNVSVSLEQVGR